MIREAFLKKLRMERRVFWAKGPETEESKELLGADPRPALLESQGGVMQGKARKVAGAGVKDFIENKCMTVNSLQHGV